MKSLVAKNKKTEISGLTSPAKIAVFSIPSNTAEGVRRKSLKALSQFDNIALGSLIELETYLEMAQTQ